MNFRLYFLPWILLVLWIQLLAVSVANKLRVKLESFSDFANIIFSKPFTDFQETEILWNFDCVTSYHFLQYPGKLKQQAYLKEDTVQTRVTCSFSWSRTNFLTLELFGDLFSDHFVGARVHNQSLLAHKQFRLICANAEFVTSAIFV